MTTLQLTPAQHAILAYAIEHTAGQIDWFPDTVKGGARTKVLAGLANRGLAAHQDGAWRVTDAGYAALGHVPSIPTNALSAAQEAALEADVAAAEAAFAPEPAKPRTRDNTKQATILAMLRRPEGATIPLICEATGWQSHTVRGFFAGAFKKKLGLALVSEKTKGTDRVYRIADQAA